MWEKEEKKEKGGRSDIRIDRPVSATISTDTHTRIPVEFGFAVAWLLGCLLGCWRPTSELL